MTSHPSSSLRRRVLTITASAIAALIATAIIINAFLVPPPKPAGTNNVVTGDFGRSEYPNVPPDEHFTSSKVVNGCRVGVGTRGSWNWTADSFRLRFRLTSWIDPADGRYKPITDGHDTNSWGSRTVFDVMAKVGHSYRFGPATVKVLQVWDSPILQYRRAYLNVTFDESHIHCPPTDYGPGPPQ
ncbi:MULTISPECIES: hypothetical protein [unclassified Leifsonia]|uniref:hypothetical protein n=1 Tax=unclassified Leifsonia TaxID=2663824 RepID=UPI0008A7D076|nr:MULTISPECIES: hypothetical protein [unclassified Leifsonia]SEH76062.1 hypothetical protein SAMN04515694_103237 [Leifsonia sp. CL154]SFL37641.1 hypothetical protein SAMN04515692_103238 [Leifsonia sp. CL147]